MSALTGALRVYKRLLLHTTARHVSGGPAELERVASRWAVDVQHIAREAEIFDFEGAHSASVHFGKRYAAVGDNRSIESHEARYREWCSFQDMNKAFAFLFGQAVSVDVRFGEREKMGNGFR